MSILIPQDLLPSDGRFGSGPAKVRPEALDYLSMRGDLMGTSHRQAPVRDLVRVVQQGLAELYRIPEGYEVVLGNGGSTLFWDMAVASLIERRSAHGVFGEFTRKFAKAAERAPHLESPVVTEAPAGQVAVPGPADVDTYAWAQSETSTGAVAPVSRVGDGLILIDATSSAGGMDAPIGDTDVYYFAPQKNFSSDGGLWLAFASPAAVERAEQIKASGRWLPEILDFSLAVKNSRQNQTLNTPALATLLLLEDQIGWMLDLGGIDAVAARCAASTSILYRWAEKRDFASPFVTSEAARSPIVATIDLDEHIDASQVIAALRENGIVDVDPYRALKRNQLRVGCYASVDPDDVEALTACLDYVIERL
ncbi:phosphoserine aminotransferase apoenzyme [Tessaracoccus bendigoensis DSM 12906]|uniref:phosphoserine transaminase n=1 Tax=Tessaracoccus bendigoensis DSM 12906 TaxID=1123357 RepID=A0A1M6M3G9_9ACTN|nr:phosphoserine transaminase [Tessaracoccus bendigoensis]SHJ77992.1 phosphoserine aminotransferase apoenzyme [Tessaracoccus bendigoensis DSM 12906]